MSTPTIADRLRALADEVALLELVTQPQPPVEPEPEPPALPALPAELQYAMTHDDGTGPSRDEWSKQARVKWRNLMGDWTDAAGAAQGDVPFGSVAITAVGGYSVALPDVQPLRLGILLRTSGKSSPYVTVSGRVSDAPPVLHVTLADGSTRTLPCLSLATWNSSTLSASDTRQQARLTPTTNAAAVFDIPPEAVSGVMEFAVTARSYTATIAAFALQPPGITLPRLHGVPDAPGIAATVQSAAELRAHPDVLGVSDWTDMRTRQKGGPIWTGISVSENADQQVIEDSTSPGGAPVLRCRFRDRAEFAAAMGKTLSWADQNGRGCLSLTAEQSPADLTDPLRAPVNVIEEMFLRVYFLLEGDWLATNDANKMAIGWDMRYGWWNESGYWQQTTGNGGSRGSGLKKRIQAGVYSGQKREQWVYEGHSLRMEAGIGPADHSHPYDALRPVQTYTYSLDQSDFNGAILRHGNAMIERGRWHCIEQRVKTNSVRPMTAEDHAWETQQIADGWLPASRASTVYAGGFDELGNGGAAPDGVLQTWLDGVLIDSRQNMRWRRHPDIGVGSPWINWYFGGKQAANREMHFRMGEVVLARSYIGPRAG